VRLALSQNIAVDAVTAHDAVQGTSELVGTLFCFVLTKLTKLALFHAIASDELTDQLEVMG
jgi:hypothetical protein